MFLGCRLLNIVVIENLWRNLYFAKYMTYDCLVSLKPLPIEMPSTLLLINHGLDPLKNDLRREL